MKFDEILVRIGEFGSYQKRVYFLLCLPAALCGLQVMIIVFVMATPPHRCAIPGYPNDTYGVHGPQHKMLINLTIPPGDEDTQEPYSECDIFADVNTSVLLRHGYDGNYDRNVTARGTRACSKYVYDRSEYDTTAATEFNIVCDRKILRSHSNMAQFAGALCGSIFMGVVADVLGRKKAIMLSLVIQFVSSLTVVFTPSFEVMIAARAVAGIATHSLFAISASTGIELVGPNKRTFTGSFVEIYWSIGVLLVLPIAYAVRNWRYIQLAVCLLTLPLFSLWWLIPESPRWLLDKKRYAETERILEKICRSNKTKLPAGAVDAETGDEGPQVKLWQIFTHRVLVIRTLIIFYNWLAVNLLYYGLSLNLDNLAGSTYVNFLISSVVEVVAYIICLFILDRTGRKKLHCFCMFLGAVAALAVMLPVTLGNGDHQWATTLLAMIGKLCASGCYLILYIMSAELFPTVLRNSAIGCCSVFENVGGMVAPYIADMGLLIGGPFAQGLPMLVFGSISALGGFLSLALPETLHRTLPETIQDAIDFDKQKSSPPSSDCVTSSTEQELQIPLESLKL